MRKVLYTITAVLLAPSLSFGQTVSSCAQISGQLATAVASAAERLDAAQAQIADLQKQLDALKKPEQPHDK